MQYTTLLLAFVASLVSAQNPFTMTTMPTAIQAGQPFTITWNPSTGTTDTISLVLRQGDPDHLNTVTTIVSGLANTGTYAWTPDSSIPSGSQYALQITDDGNPDITNYSGQFGISSDTSAPSDASSAAASFETGKGLTNTDSVSMKSTAAASSGTETGSGSVTGSETGSASGSGSGSATETGSGSTGGSLTATGTGSSGSLTASITGTQRAQETSTSGGSSAESSGSSSEKESATGSGGSKTTSSSRSSSSSSAKPSETKNAAPNSGLQLSGGLLAMVGALMAAL